jgi:hypothetical protein
MTAHDERTALPLAHYDHITAGDLPARINGLSADGVKTLLEYERNHADRLPIVIILEHRAHALAEGAEPSGEVLEDSPTMNHGTPGGDRVTPATAGPKINPPSQGDPTNPAQPR